MIISFEQVICALNNIIEIVIQNDISEKLISLNNKYKQEKILNTESSLLEINNYIKEQTTNILTIYISKQYKKELNKFFTDNGLSYYIISKLKNSILTSLDEGGK